MYSCLCVCACTGVHVCVCVCVRVCVCVCACVCVCVCVHACVHVCMHTCLCVQVCMHVCVTVCMYMEGCEKHIRILTAGLKCISYNESLSTCEKDAISSRNVSYGIAIAPRVICLVHNFLAITL